MTSDERIRIKFDGLTLAEANQAAAELQEMVVDAADRAGEEVGSSVERHRTDTQDFGATLVLVLGTPAAVAVVRAIHAYIAKRGSRVVIETADGARVVATGDAAANIDVARTVEAMRARR
ncbi:hypothetical protein [Dactylosporangium sp. NPDC048998]|uniref:hypothetical protein n=1 Tax=Dactylosporangium sp. NPDC048998 TaxID=3363976 RepID=UPI0037155079